MPSNVKNRGTKRIKGIPDIELLEWARKIRVRPEVLREAVYAVGDDALKVDTYLKARRGRDSTFA